MRCLAGLTHFEKRPHPAGGQNFCAAAAVWMQAAGSAVFLEQLGAGGEDAEGRGVAGKDAAGGGFRKRRRDGLLGRQVRAEQAQRSGVPSDAVEAGRHDKRRRCVENDVVAACDQIRSQCLQILPVLLGREPMIASHIAGSQHNQNPHGIGFWVRLTEHRLKRRFGFGFRAACLAGPPSGGAGAADALVVGAPGRPGIRLGHAAGLGITA